MVCESLLSEYFSRYHQRFQFSRNLERGVYFIHTSKIELKFSSEWGDSFEKCRTLTDSSKFWYVFDENSECLSIGVNYEILAETTIWSSSLIALKSGHCSGSCVPRTVLSLDGNVIHDDLKRVHIRAVTLWEERGNSFSFWKTLC